MELKNNTIQVVAIDEVVARYYLQNEPGDVYKRQERRFKSVYKSEKRLKNIPSDRLVPLTDDTLEEKGDGFIKAMWCGDEACEDLSLIHISICSRTVISIFLSNGFISVPKTWCRPASLPEAYTGFPRCV